MILATLGSLGDLHPMLALGRGLARRGARVVVATSPPFEEGVTAAGLDFAPLGPDHLGQAPALMQRVLDARHGPRVLIAEILMPMLRQTHRELGRLCEDADLLVSGEVVYCAPILAAQRGLPWASVTLSPMPFLSLYDPPLLPQARWLYRLRGLGPGFHRLVFALGRWQSRRWCREVTRLRRELGLPPGEHPLFEGKHAPGLVLAMFSRLLAEPQPDWPANTVQTGFAHYDGDTALDPALAAFLDAGPAPVVFTLGSAAVLHPGSFFTESLMAVRELGLRAVLLCGDHAELPSLPDGVLALPYAPYTPLFARASAVVHSGGIGTLARTLRAGVPMLVVPQANDQPDNAARALRLGVARVIAREDYRAATVGAALQALRKDPGVAARAAEIATALAREDAVARACEALNGYLAGRGPG